MRRETVLVKFVFLCLTFFLLATQRAPQQQASSSFEKKLVREVPKLAFLRVHDPATFAKIAKIYEDGERAGKTTDELIGLARSAFASAQNDRLTHAPDYVLLRSLQSTIGVGRDLLRTSPERCAALFAGGNAGDIKQFLSPTTQRAEDANFELLFASATGPASPPATADEEQQFLVRAVAAEARAANITPMELVTRATATPAGFCELQINILTRLNDAPNAAALFRGRISSAQNANE